MLGRRGRVRTRIGCTALGLAVVSIAMFPGRSLGEDSGERSVFRPVLGGLVAGAFGLVAGAAAGAAIDHDCRGSSGLCIDSGIAVGAVIGEALTMPLGVHSGNGKRGNLALVALTSVATVACGVALAESGADEIWVALPFAQVIACTVVERWTAR